MEEHLSILPRTIVATGVRANWMRSKEATFDEHVNVGDTLSVNGQIISPGNTDTTSLFITDPVTENKYAVTHSDNMLNIDSLAEPGTSHVYHIENTVDAVTMRAENPNEGENGILRTTADTDFKVLSTTASVSSNTGAVTVAGGIGIGQDAHIGGAIHVNDVTPATDTTASISTLGGVFATKDLRSESGEIYMGTDGVNNTYINIVNGDDMQINTGNSFILRRVSDDGNITITPDVVNGAVISSSPRLNVACPTNITDDTESTSANVGSLVSAGGAGFGKNVYSNKLVRGTEMGPLNAKTITKIISNAVNPNQWMQIKLSNVSTTWLDTAPHNFSLTMYDTTQTGNAFLDITISAAGDFAATFQTTFATAPQLKGYTENATGAGLLYVRNPSSTLTSVIVLIFEDHAETLTSDLAIITDLGAGVHPSNIDIGATHTLKCDTQTPGSNLYLSGLKLYNTQTGTSDGNGALICSGGAFFAPNKTVSLDSLDVRDTATWYADNGDAGGLIRYDENEGQMLFVSNNNGYVFRKFGVTTADFTITMGNLKTTLNSDTDVIEIHSTDTVKITNTTQATALNTGAFQVTGGASVAQNLYVGGTLNAAGGVQIEAIDLPTGQWNDLSMILSAGSSPSTTATYEAINGTAISSGWRMNDGEILNLRVQIHHGVKPETVMKLHTHMTTGNALAKSATDTGYVGLKYEYVMVPHLGNFQGAVTTGYVAIATSVPGDANTDNGVHQIGDIADITSLASVSAILTLRLTRLTRAEMVSNGLITDIATNVDEPRIMYMVDVDLHAQISAFGRGSY